MNITAPDALVGAVALECVLLKFGLLIEEDDFRGVFHVLSGFSAEQLIGFIQAKDAAAGRAKSLQIQFPESELQKYGVSGAYLTSDSSVDVRNRERNQAVVLTAEIESDVEASLSHSDRTDASDLKAREFVHIWIDYIAKNIGLNLLPEDRRKVEAMLKGLFDTGRCPTAKAGEFLMSVLSAYSQGELLLRAAGKALPIIGLPLFEDCFSSLNEAKMAQPSQWAAKFKSHYLLECYLDKRGLQQEVLESGKLRETLEKLRSDAQQPPLSEALLNAFHDYIESENKRNIKTEALLFGFDWEFSKLCFERSKKTSSKDFSERTRNALEADGITPSPDDELVIQSAAKIARKPGSAPDEFKEFFERRAVSLEKESSLYLEWEDFVHGKKIECVDLYQGIFECIQRAIRGLSSHEAACVVLEGRQQKIPNHFLETNQRACEFFERAYGLLEAQTKRRVRFTETMICQYSQEVLPIIKDKAKFKGVSKTGKANTLNFLVSVFERSGQDLGRKVATLSLAWKFPFDSVFGQEITDFGSICRYLAHRGTALVDCIAEYEAVGRKGSPMPLSLENVEGFADAARGGGRGAFIPAQDRIKSLADQWKELLENAAARHWLPPEQIDGLAADFGAFASVYNEAVLVLRLHATAGEKATIVSNAYRALLLRINQLKHQEARRSMLRVVLRVGLAQVNRSGRRPPMAVICPWHPIRMEAAAARQEQVFALLDLLLGKDRPPFSDGATGPLFFREVEQLLDHPLYPELAIVWENTQPYPRVATQAFGSYTLHQPPEPSSDSALLSLDDESKQAAATIEHEMLEYLRLQPHERNNLSILLYNCDSPNLPTAVVENINRLNATRDDDKITCQVLLMHRDEEHLRQIYRDLVSRGVDSDADPTEASGDFLAKVRVNITAAKQLRRDGRSQPVDIAYCRDLTSQEARVAWEWQLRESSLPADLKPHQWSRRLPVNEGDRRVLLQLACPAQTESGWAWLYSIAAICANGADDAWAAGKCPVLMRQLDFDDQKVERIFRETHELATWVINQDELLDRKLLEARHVKVIRYVQSATHGRNLIISSGARETLLVNTLREKLRALLASTATAEFIDGLCERFMADANRISGGLVLKAARRANNTNELLGMVLSRYLVQSELGTNRPIAWCFLDDYGQWLGKKEGANIADLLVLAPRTDEQGKMHLDIVVTEAKFVIYDAYGTAASTSAKQLMDTLSQLTEAMDGETRTIDQEVWLARLSDLLITQSVVAPGQVPLNAVAWRRAIRERQCTVSIWGYSHVFINEPQDLTAQVSSTKGIVSSKGKSELDALQEVFGPGHVRELVMQYEGLNASATATLRLHNGHPPFGKSKLYHLTSKAKSNCSDIGNKSESSDDFDGGAALLAPDPAKSLVSGMSKASVQQPGDQEAAAAVTSEPQKVIVSDETPSPLIEFLEGRAAIEKLSEKEGQTWLENVTMRLRHALVTRGLPAKLVEGLAPILTPNAGIIKLQGSKDLTVQAVESRSAEIYTSEGIKIINTTPESGRVSVAVERPQREMLYTEPVLLDYLRVYNSQTAGEKLLVGIREEDGQPLLLDPFSQPHTLIAGMTGSGKSVLMQNLILSIAATRSPQEAHIYLIDPKFGVDYRPLDKLPHVAAGSGGIIDDPTAAVQTLTALVDEMNRRYELFKHVEQANNIHAYRRLTGKALPVLWVIHDEFADWMQIPEYKEAVPNIVGRLSVKARAAGIFLLFAAQRPDKDVMPMQLRSQLGNRLILQVDNAGTAEIAMGIKNSGAERLLGRGHMLAKLGNMPEPVFAQVPFVDMEHTIPELVKLIQARYKTDSHSS